MLILGISALYHDSAAAIVQDGEIIAAAQEERFTRIKHDLSLPVHAVRYCLDEAGADLKDIDYVVYYDNPLLTLDRFCKNVLALGGDSGLLLERSAESIFGRKLWIHEGIEKMSGGVRKEWKSARDGASCLPCRVSFLSVSL